MLRASFNKERDIHPSSDVASLLQYDISDNNTIICQCNKAFTDIEQWEIHNFHYHLNLKYMCTHCNFRYLHINDFVNHMRFEHFINYHYCSICKNLYYSSDVFAIHVYWCHASHQYRGTYICYKCTPWRVMYYNQLVSHDSREHSANSITEEFICYVCGKKFGHSGYINLVSHRSSHYKMKTRKCEERSCRGRLFATLIELKEHIIENHEGRFLCTKCFSNFSFKTKYGLQSHVEQTHILITSTYLEYL